MGIRGKNPTQYKQLVSALTYSDHEGKTSEEEEDDGEFWLKEKPKGASNEETKQAAPPKDSGAGVNINFSKLAINADEVKGKIASKKK